MMKKLVFLTLAAAGLLLAGSCTREELGADNSGDTATISIGLSLENAAQTRAISDGSGANSLYYAVFDEDGVQVGSEREYVGTVTFPTQASVTLAKGRTYQIAFWAQNSNCTAYTVGYDAGLTVDVDYTGALNNDEDRDAFFAAVTLTVTGNTSLSVGLKRPFAQVNVGVTQDDWDTAVEDGVVVSQSEVTFGVVANRLNLLDGSVEGAVELTYDLNDIPYDTVMGQDEQGNDVPQYLYVDVDGDGDTDEANEQFVWLSMSYVLVSNESDGAGKATTSADFNFYNENTGDIYLELADGLNDLPVQRNWRTNILGTILSGVVDFNIYIDPYYDGDYDLIGDDGEYIAEGVTYYKIAQVYGISSLDGLKWLSDRVNGANNYGTNADMEQDSFSGETFTLEEDIDMSTVSNWVPIGSSTSKYFMGIFNGNHLTISNLKVNMSTDDESGDGAGLFGYVDLDEICDLTIENASVKGHDYVGVVAGFTFRSHKLSGITLKGTVQVEGNKCIGGISGMIYGDMSDITIDVDSDSYVKGTYEGSNGWQGDQTCVGGVIGLYGENWQQNGYTVQNIESNINVLGAQSAVGGLIGFIDYGDLIVDSHSSGNVEIYGTDKTYAGTIGGIAGMWDESIEGHGPSFENCSYTGTMTTNDEDVDLWANLIVGAPYQESGNGVLYIDDYVVSVDRTNAGLTIVDYGPVESGRNHTAYGIYSSDGLMWLANEVNVNKSSIYNDTVVLTRDIDMTGVDWTPIGNNPWVADGKAFNGSFDGNGHTISNLTIDKPDMDYVGLFGYIYDFSYDQAYYVKNLTIKDATVTGNNNVGVFAGCAMGIDDLNLFENITLEGTIKVEGNSTVGGVCGQFYGSCDGITINVESDSYVKGTLSDGDHKTDFSGWTNVGGAFGVYGEHYNDGSVVKNIESNIDVEGAECCVGGVIGLVAYGNEVVNCHSTGNVKITGTDDETYADMVGGVAGSWNNSEPGGNVWPVYFKNCTFDGTLATSVESVDLTDNTIVGGKLYADSDTGSLYVNGSEMK